MQDNRTLNADLVRHLQNLLQDRPATKPPNRATRSLNAKIDAVLAKLTANYLACRKDQRKAAIYPYLEAVYSVGVQFEEWGQSGYVMKRSAETGGPKARQDDSVFSYLLRTTSTANRKTRSTWARVLEVAHSQEEDDGCLIGVIKDARGLKLYIRKFAGQEVDGTEDEHDGWGDDEDFELNDRTRKDLQRSIPAAPKAALREAKRCFDVTAYTATVVMCDVALQRACAAHQITAKDTVAALNGLQEKKLVGAEVLTKSRGNVARTVEAAYSGQTAVKRSDAGEALEFTRAIFDALFQ